MAARRALHGSRNYLDDVLGPTRVVADRSWPHSPATVVELRDTEGATWFVKRHRDTDCFRRELRAYHNWVPALLDRAPALRTHSVELQVLVLSPVAGQPGLDVYADARVQRDAGTVLRRLHDSARLPDAGDYAAERVEEFEQLAEAATELLEEHELDFVRSRLNQFSKIANQAQVPCHMHYTPRNWLVDAGRVQVIDF